MKKVSALFMSMSLVMSPVAFAQQQAGGAGAGGGAAGGAAGAGAAAGAAAAAVAAAVSANKADPVYTTTNSGTGAAEVCIANC